MQQIPNDNEEQGGGSVDPSLPAPAPKKDKSFLYFGYGVALLIAVALIVRACHGA